MVALALVALVATSVYHLVAQSAAMSAAERFATLAPLFAREVLTALETDGSRLAGTRTGDGGSDFPGLVWESDCRPAPLAGLGEAGERFVRIEVTVRQEQGAEAFRLTTYRLAPE
jgi:type II secretory pathway component PulJ